MRKESYFSAAARLKDLRASMRCCCGLGWCLVIRCSSSPIEVAGVVAASAEVSDLRDAWDKALRSALHVETEERLVPGALQKS